MKPNIDNDKGWENVTVDDIKILEDISIVPNKGEKTEVVIFENEDKILPDSKDAKGGVVLEKGKEPDFIMTDIEIYGVDFENYDIVCKEGGESYKIKSKEVNFLIRVANVYKTG